MPYEPKVGELPALLPCPFCGKSVAYIFAASGLWCVICNAAHPNGPDGCGGQSGFKPSQEEAISAWNTRAEREGRKDEVHDAALWRHAQKQEWISKGWTRAIEDEMLAALQAEHPEKS